MNAKRRCSAGGQKKTQKSLQSLETREERDHHLNVLTVLLELLLGQLSPSLFYTRRCVSMATLDGEYLIISTSELIRLISQNQS